MILSVRVINHKFHGDSFYGLKMSNFDESDILDYDDHLSDEENESRDDLFKSRLVI